MKLAHETAKQEMHGKQKNNVNLNCVRKKRRKSIGGTDAIKGAASYQNLFLIKRRIFYRLIYYPWI